MCLDPRNLLLSVYSGHNLREIKQPGHEADHSFPSNAEVIFFFFFSCVFLEYIVPGSHYEVGVTVRFVEEILGSRRVKC
jgi:hypothetical protein